MDQYDRGPALGEGTFGSVYKATHKKTGQVYAIKKIRLGNAKEGLNVTALREIKLLREMRSPHVILLHDVFEHKKSLNLVMEFMASDLEAIIKDHSIVLSPANVKSYMQMILQGLAECHKSWVVHRDVKPNNCLLAPSGELKLADFGLARIFGSPDRRYTNQVFARWYRPPELFFGATIYGAAIDVYAAGCIFAELLLRRPWLPGESDIDQLGKIFQAVGTPTEASWPDCSALPNYMEFHRVPPTPWAAMFPKASDDCLDLLSRMVALNPARRPSCEEALQHPYFTSYPQPTPPAQLPRPVAREKAPLTQAPMPTVRITRPSNTPAEVLEADALAEATIAAALAAGKEDSQPPSKRRITEAAKAVAAAAGALRPSD